ncbi:MAG: BspA family leucine-rich repeat surface protein [Lachnospiraceae bacterium]|nr:BspA family leucine-rich repeat surface protein [Lachnospiraceae bacterium]
MTRRVLAMLLVLLMVVAMVPTEAFATDSDIRETEYTDPSIGSEPETIPEETNRQPVETSTSETEDIRQPDDLERNDPDPDGQMAQPVQANDAISVQVSAGAVFTDGKWVWTPQTNTAGHRFIFGINYSSSGIGEIQPGELQIRIPKNVILDRNGDPADELELSIPSEEETRELATEEELEQIDLVWREDGDEILIFNYKAVSAAENGYIEVAYAMTEKVVMYQDMGESAPFYAKYNVIINEEEIAAESEELHVHIDTHAKVGSTSKRWPTYYTNWSTSWGQAPEDADDYTYLVWEIRTLINEDSNQPYDLIFEDTILSSSNGEEEVVGFKLAGQTEYSDLNHVEGQTATGYRYDYVLTRRPKEAFQGLTQWDVTNQIQVTLHPADNIDADNTVKSQKKFVWEKPSFDSPTGSFKIYKRADGAFRNDTNDQWLKAPGLVAGEYSRYDLNDFYEGDIERLDNLDYALWIRGYPYPWTIQDGANPQDPTSYGVNPVKYVLIDNGIEVHDDETEILDVGYGDYQIDYITYSVNIKDAVYNETTMKFTESAPTYKDSDIVSFYGKFADSDEWVLIATRNLKTRENWFDPLYVRSMTASKITLQDDCLTFKVELENAHFYTCVTAVPNFALKNSDSVMAFCFEKNEISVLNRAEGHIYDYRGNEILHDEEEDYDYARSTKRDSSLEKKVVASTNVPRKKAYVISWRIKESELATYGSEGAKEYIRQQSGVFYDLLPEGCILDLTSVAVQGEDTYLSDTAFTVTQLPNYKNSGRTMLIVTVHESARYYTLYFDTIHPWESIKDHGHDVYNPVAYETGNDDIAMGYPDNGGAKNLEDNVTWNDEDMFSDQEFTDYFTDLDQETNDPKFIYAENTYDISAITTAAAGLTKRVRGVEDTKWAYEAWTTIGGDYQYRLRFMNTYTSIAKDLIFYDSIENYTAEDVVSDWHGILQSIDLSQLEEKGVAPVVYISEIEGLDLEGETNFIPNNDLTNEDIWTVWDGTTSLVNVKAIAIDMRTNNTEEPFILNPGESVVVTLHFKAPASATSQGTYPETYNNVYVADTIVSLLGNETPFFIHQDYTTVRYVVTADIPLRKVSAENENIRVPGIQFKLYGTSDYGNEVSQILTTDRNGEIRFENIEKGHYILQEYETNDDWLFDGTEHQIVVDGEGHVWSDGAAITDSPIIIENTPRIHGDIRIIKSPEDLSRDWSTVDGAGEESGDVGEPVEPIDTNDAEEAEPASAQAETSVEYASGIPDTTFKLSGISVYGTEVMMLETTNATGRIVFRNVEQGTYTLEEVIPNENFVQNTSKWTVTIDETGTANIREPEEENRDRLYFVTPTSQSFSLENENRFWDFKLYKIDSYNRTIFLEGATFTLIGTSDFGTQYNLTETTNNQGYVRFMHLEKGSYILRETVAPTGVDENGQLGGNRNYILDAADHIVQINERGIVTIDGAVLTENGELGILNDRAMDGTITITKIWNDFVTDDADRPIPKLHLSTREIATNRNVYITVNWTGTDDTAETRPSSIKLYIGLADGTVVSDKTEILNSPGNPTTVKMTALLDPNETYYVWTDNALGYEALTSAANKAALQKTDDKTVGAVTFRKYPPTILVAGSTFNTRIGRNLTSFTRAESIPEGVTTFLLSTPTSGLPVYAWKDGTDVYWYSDADTIYMNPDCSTMFMSCTKITYLDLRDFDSSKVTNMKQMFSNCTSLRNLDVSGFDTSNVTSMWDMFYNYKGSSLDVSNFNVEKVTSFSGMFYGCSNLATIDVSNWNTKSATTFYQMFNGCSAVTVLDVSNWKTGNATDMRNMFSNCSSLSSVDVLNWDVGEVTSMSSMFQSSGITSINISGWNCGKVERMDYMLNNTKISVADVSNIDLSRLRSAIFMFAGTQITSIDLSDWNCPNLTTIEEMFTGCRQLQSINLNGMYAPKLSVIKKLFQWCGNLTEVNFVGATFGKVTNMSGTFNGCTKLQTINWADLDLSSLTNLSETFKGCSSLQYVDLSGMQTGNVTTMAELFSGCSKLTSVDLSGFDTHSVTSMASMFYGCAKLEELHLENFITDNVTSMGSMFRGCTILSELDLSSFNTEKVTSMANMFYGCRGLTALDLSMFDTSSLTTIASMFLDCQNLADLNLSGWTTPKLKDMSSAFYSCFALMDLDLSSFDTSHVTTMVALFQHDRFTSVDLSSFDTSSVVNTTRMFYSCRQCTTIYVSEKWNMDNVTDSSAMFAYCPSLPNYISSENDKTHANYDVGGYLTYKAAPAASNPGSLIITKPSGLVFFPVGVQERALNDFEDVNEDPTAITDVPDLPMDETDPEPDIAGGTFNGLDWRITSDGELIIGEEGETQTIPQNTARSKAFFPWHAYASQVNSISFRGSVTTTWQMVYAFADLKITEFNSTNLDTSHVTNFGETFMGCSKLQHFDFTGMDTTKVTSTYEMFSGCSSLETVDLSDFVGAPLRTTAHMFSGCSKLNNINFTNFNTSNVNDMKGMFKGCSSLISLDLTMLNTSNVTNMGDMFYNCSMLSTIDVSSFNTSKVTNMSNMFDGCASIETLDLSSWNTEKVTTMAGMFNRCKKLVLLNVSGFDTSKVTTMASMFSGCSSLTSLDLTPLNTEKVTTMASMFSGCSSLTSLDVSPLNTSNVKNMASMFASTTALRELDLTPLETGAVTSMGSMFSGSGLDSVDITTFDCTNVTSMVSMFAKMPNCTEINLTGIQTPKLTEIGSMFMSSKKITDLDLSSMDVSKVTSMQSVWEGCSGLQNLDVSTWNTASLTRLVNTFAGCTSLKNLDLSSWDTSKVNIMQYMMSGIKVEETLNLKNWKMSQVTGSIGQAFGLRNAPNVLVFSDDMRFSGTGFSGSTKYVHKTDGAGNRLYEQQPKTMSQIAALPKEEVAGKWVKDGYIPGINSLGDGDYEYVSQDNEWVKNGNVWTYTFDVFDDSIPYFLVEEPIEGYDSLAMYTSIQINANGEVTKMATIVNTAEMKTGSLEVAKQVIGATTTQKFDFTVTLAGPAISGTQIFSDTIFTNGVATIKLANGETKTFSEIPVDTTYTVTEATPSNYTCEAFNSSGTIIEDLTQSATFVNTYVPPEVEKVDVTLAKEVVGQFEQESSYRFVAQFANLEAGKTYETSKQGTTFTADAHGTAIIAVTLAAGESVQFIDLPVGSTYLFAEDAGAYISAYQITDANGVSSIVSSAAENQDENVGLSTAVETANEGEAVTVTFINTLRRTANLTLRKEMVSPETDSNRFEFDVTLTGLTPGAKLGSSVGLFIADEEGIAKKTVLLAAGETMEIEGIPVGANYQISENSTKYIAAYQITEGDTNEVIAAGANETQGNSLSTSIETIHEGKNAVVTFTNTFVRPGTVTVTKYDANKQPLSNVPMRLEYSIDNGRTWQPIESRTTPDDGYYPRGLSSTQGIVDGILRTDVNGKATFTGLSVEATIQYRILEVSTQNGLMLMKDPVTVSALPEVKTFDTLDALRTFLAAYNQKTTSYLDYDVDEENLTVRITHAFYELYNTTAIKMPAAGGNGFVALPVAFICWAAVLTVLIGEEQRRRKRTKQQ